MFKCLNNRVLIKPIEKSDKTAGGIYVVETIKEKPVIGIVIVGNKDVKEDDKVLFSKFGYDEVMIENELYYVCGDFNLLGIFENNE